MAQAIRKINVRKNCIDVEKVIMECLSEPEIKKFILIVKSDDSTKLSKELLKYTSKSNAKYHQELISINRVHQKSTYRNFAVY